MLSGLRGRTNTTTRRSRCEIAAGKPPFYARAIATEDVTVQTTSALASSASGRVCVYRSSSFPRIIPNMLRLPLSSSTSEEGSGTPVGVTLVFPLPIKVDPVKPFGPVLTVN